MQKYLALIALPAAALCHAQVAEPARRLGTGIQQVSVQKPLSASAAAPRQLTPEQRAELRRQLSQYRRAPGKGS